MDKIPERFTDLIYRVIVSIDNKRGPVVRIIAVPAMYKKVSAITIGDRQIRFATLGKIETFAFGNKGMTARTWVKTPEEAQALIPGALEKMKERYVQAAADTAQTVRSFDYPLDVVVTTYEKYGD